MISSEPASITTSPLCTTDTMKLLLESSELYSKTASGIQQSSNWELQNRYMKQGMVTAGNQLYLPTVHVLKYIFESLDKAFALLKSSFEETKKNQETTFAQMMNGQAFEFNKVIESIVERKLKELRVGTEQKEISKKSDDKIKTASKTLKEITPKLSDKSLPHDEKIKIINKAITNINQTLSRFRPETEAEEFLVRLIGLLDSINQSK